MPNTSAVKRGFKYDFANARMDVYVDGTKMFYLDPTNTRMAFDAIDLLFGDDDYILFGDTSGGDITLRWDGTNSLLQFLPTTDDTGYVAVGNGTTSMDFMWYGGSAAVYVLFDVGNEYLSLEGTALRLGDNDEVKFGDGSGGDIRMSWNGSKLNILPLTDDTGYIAIGDGTTDMDLWVTLGAKGSYVQCDVGNKYFSLVNTQLYLPDIVTTAPSNTTGLVYMLAGRYLCLAS